MSKAAYERSLFTRSASFHIWVTFRLNPVQTDETLLDVTCCVRLHTLLFACCCVLLGVVAKSLKQAKLLAMCKGTQHLLTLLGELCWELLSPFARTFKEFNGYPRFSLYEVLANERWKRFD